jgi:hypothetical protein
MLEKSSSQRSNLLQLNKQLTPFSDPSKLSYNHNEDLRNHHSGSNVAPELANPSQPN